jgi:hypothetical protein
MPQLPKVVIGTVALDQLLYTQHALHHAILVPWRLHMGHHADLDFDMTTGLRFQPIDIIVSIFGLLQGPTRKRAHRYGDRPVAIRRSRKAFPVAPPDPAVGRRTRPGAHQPALMRTVVSNTGHKQRKSNRTFGH